MKIVVFPEKLQELGREFENSANKVASIENSLRQAVANLDWETRRKANVEGSIRSMQNLSSGLRGESQDMSRFLSMKAQAFLDADRQGAFSAQPIDLRRFIPWLLPMPIPNKALLELLGSDGYQKLYSILSKEFVGVGDFGINVTDLAKFLKGLHSIPGLLDKSFDPKFFWLNGFMRGMGPLSVGAGKELATRVINNSLKNPATWILTGVTAALDLGSRWGKDYRQYHNDPSKLAIAGGVSAVETGLVTAAGVAGGIAGAKLGTMAGAAIGTAICPGVGTFIGGVVGGVVGRAAGSWLASEGAELLVDRVIEPNKGKIVDAVDNTWHQVREQGGEVVNFYRNEAREHGDFWGNQINETREFFNRQVADFLG